MSLKQKPNKHQKTKSIRKTGTAGSRANRRPKHGIGKKKITRSSKKRK